MQKICLIALIAFAGAASAEMPPVTVSPAAAFSEPERIAENVKNECGLPAYQADAVRRQIEELGIKATKAEKDEVPPTGIFVQLRIEGAVSSGNAWVPFSTGHNKYVTTSVKLYENGKEVDTYRRMIHSKGGALGNFKGSCAVLENCADAIAKDVGGWVKNQLTTRNAAAPPAQTQDAAKQESPGG